MRFLSVFKTENDRIDQNHTDDEADDAGGLDPAGQAGAPWCRALISEAFDELLFEGDHDGKNLATTESARCATDKPEKGNNGIF